MDKQIAENEGAFVELLNQEMKELQESQKQIEEMAKKYPITEQDKLFNIVNSACDLIYMRKDNIEKIVKAVRNAGYRKIPEGAVVLMRERYEELEKAVDSVQVAVSSFTRLETIYKIKCKELELAEEKARKETAEKFKALLEGTVPQGLLDEIAKEITEE